MAEQTKKTMTQKEFSNSILGSIDILIDKAMTSAKFDKTINALIDSCVDAATGRYKIKYQDALYYATSNSIDDKYADNSEVYVLIPQGDFSKPKKILGKVSESTGGVSTESEDLLSYDEIGENIVSMKGSFGICSYREDYPEGIKVLYKNTVTDNLIKIDNNSFSKALQEEGCSFFGVSADFKTKLNSSQRDSGNYALFISLIYEDKNGNDQEYHYKLDVNSMEGNPYLYSQWSNQKAMFELPLGTFKEIGSIIFKADDFPNQSKEVLDDDIFIQNIKIIGMAPSDSPYFNTYNLKIDGSAGFQLSNSIIETLLTPSVYYHDKKVDSSKAEFYWFRENANISTSSNKYLNYGGMGWECLNESITITLEDSTQKKEWVSSNTFLIKRMSPVVDRLKYKCVVLLTNGAVIEKTFYITDRDYDYKIMLLASETDFSNGNGYSTLACSLLDYGDAIVNDDFEYCWNKTTNDGSVTRLRTINEITNGEGYDLSEKYLNYEIKNNLLNLRNAINLCIQEEVFNETTKFGRILTKVENENGDQKTAHGLFNEVIEAEVFKKYVKSNLASLLKKSELESVSYEKVLDAITTFEQRYYLTYIYRYVYSELPASAIVGSATYTCTVLRKDADGFYSICLGSSSIVLKNAIDTSTGSTVVIVNGDQIFKYDKDGRSPSIKTSENPNPQAPKALTFNVFDSNGNQINDGKIHTDKGAIISQWSWYVPVEDAGTFIKLDKEILDSDSTTVENQYYRIRNIKTLPFSIIDSYKEEYNQNKIRLAVKYEGKVVNGYTNFSFIKDGANGTNGTDFFCKVSLNAEPIREWPAIIYDEASENTPSSLNFSPISENKWLKATLWRNNEQVEIDEEKIKWKILKNQYIGQESGETYTTQSHFKITDNSFDYNSVNYSNIYNPSNIARAEIEYTIPKEEGSNGSISVSNAFNDKQKIYGTLPLSTIILKDKDYTIRIKPSSGYNEVVYESDGTRPAYPDRPFEVQVFERTDTGFEQNLANNKTKNNEIGTPYKCVFSIYGHNKLLTIDDWDADTYPNNICTVKPIEGYSGYETNNGLRCRIFKYNNGNYVLIGEIYHPIHLRLNKYGMSALNDWDGNSIEIDNDNGVILSPQIGAGYKEEDNSFTGMLMGTVRKDFNDTTGLFGYKGGAQTILLDAETGEARFGLAGKGQIILSPGSFTINESTGKGEFQNTSATIKGGNFVYNPEQYQGTGMEIDLTEPSIRYGSGRFEVDSDGVLTASEADIKGILTAYGGSQIGPWHITNNAIYKLGDEPLPEDEDDQEDYDDLVESKPGEDTEQDKESEPGEGSGNNSSDEGSSETEEEGSSENPDNSDN